MITSVWLSGLQSTTALKSRAKLAAAVACQQQANTKHPGKHWLTPSCQKQQKWSSMQRNVASQAASKSGNSRQRRGFRHGLLQRPTPGLSVSRISRRARAIFDFRKWTARGRGLALLNGLVLLCASNLVVLKSCEDFFDPFTFALLRFSVAAIAFWPFLKNANKDVWRAGLELGFWAGLAYLLQAEGIMTTEASRASFLSAFTVIVVPILSGMSGKGVNRITWISALMAILGIGLLEKGGGPASIGDAWNLLSAFFFGIQVFRTEHHSRKLSQDAALPLMGVVMLTVMSLSFAATTAAHPQQVQSMLRHPSLLTGALHTLSLKHLLPVFWTGLASTDAVLLIEVIALRDVPSTDAAILYTLEPVAGAAMAWGFLGERWTATGWLGAAVIVGSSLAAQFLSKPEEQKENA